MTLGTTFLDLDLDYDGSQLQSLFAYRTVGLAGDSIIAFRGACDVRNESMVDIEDLRNRETIRAHSMVHFIAEHFESALTPMVLRQRLFAHLVASDLVQAGVAGVRVAGDDVFVGDRKASISIATVTPLSGMFHFAINIDPSGAPVPAIGLGELGIDFRAFAQRMLTVYRDEMSDISHAVSKVRWVS